LAPQRILLATRNQGKLGEIRTILRDVSVELLSVEEFDPMLPEVTEDATTLEANALKKAREVHQQTGLPVLADDSGLEVYALDMRPGVISARYAGENVTYADNNRKLLRELAAVAPERRGARFRCVAAYVDETIEHIEVGTCEGSIIAEERGGGGFGYDPLFVPAGFDKTFAELSSDVKNRISHRAEAFGKIRSFLASRYAT
jgi:XTP/dITP diphosphohydrolase